MMAFTTLLPRLFQTVMGKGLGYFCSHIHYYQTLSIQTGKGSTLNTEASSRPLLNYYKTPTHVDDMPSLMWYQQNSTKHVMC